MQSEQDNFVAKFVESIDPGAMVTKYVVIAEGLGSDGERAIYTNTNEGATSWDILGLLEYASGREQAALIKHTFDVEE